MKKIMNAIKKLFSSKLFLDMDNTLAVFSYGKEDDARALVENLKPGFYANLQPMPFLWVYRIISLFIPVYIVSAHPDTPYAAEEKRLWLDTHMPWIKKENIILVPVGSNKAEIVETVVGNKISENWYLIDDFGGNLIDWQARGGTPVKKSMNRMKKREIPTIYSHYDIVKVLFKTAT